MATAIDTEDQLRPAPIGQALLFSGDIEGRIEAEESKGLYTAERLRVRRPDTYQAIATMIGAGYSLRKIAEILSVHQRTAAAVRDAEPEAIDAVRLKMVNRMRTAIDLQIDRLIDHPDAVPMNVAALVISQLVDKSELLSGRATQRIEHVDRIDVYSDWDHVVSQLPDEKQLSSEQVLEVSPGTRLGAGNLPALEAAGLDAGQVLASQDLGQMQAASDRLSQVPTASPLVDRQSATDQATDRGPDPEHGQAGGEGVRRQAGGPQTPTRPDA